MHDHQSCARAPRNLSRAPCGSPQRLRRRLHVRVVEPRSLFLGHEFFPSSMSTGFRPLLSNNIQ